MRYLLSYCLIAILFFSCRKFNEVSDPDFEVTVEKTTYGVHEPITFNFKGTANIITFYSGAPGKEYEFKNRFRVDGGKPQLRFTSFRQYGEQDGLPDSTLELLVSTDYKNVLDVESLQNATWTDITDRTELSAAVYPSTEYTLSGVVDLSDFARVDTPIYIAFRYHDVKSDVSQRTWTIKDVSIDNVLPDGSMVNVANMSNLSWGILDLMNTSRKWSFSSKQLQMSGGGANTDDNDDWLISKPLSLDRVQRSLGISVKSSPTALQTSYVFPGYAEPGTYKVTFEVINANRWDQKMVVREILITVQ